MSEYTIRDTPGKIGLLSYPNKVLHNTPPYPAISVVTHNPESLGFQDYVFYISVGWILLESRDEELCLVKTFGYGKSHVGKNTNS